MARFIGSPLHRNLRALQVYGANTNVGKTIFSTLLLRAALSRKKEKQQQRAWYLKPVSTGAIGDADAGHVQRYARGVETKCLVQFEEAVSPHLAAKKNPPADASLLAAIHAHLTSCARHTGTLLLETAGGVHSPTPAATSQVDAYRPLRLPVLLVADSHLGGISASISAFESLLIRGYDVGAVMLFRDDVLRNHEYLCERFAARGIPTAVVPKPPMRDANSDLAADHRAMESYYDTESVSEVVRSVVDVIDQQHELRIEKLESMAKEAVSTIWYPFTQHKHVTADSITTIDSAHGDFFQSYFSSSSSSNISPEKSHLNPMYDASASWWTQGLGHSDPDLTLSAAYAAGRYGHVMFAGTIHEPALSLAKLLLTSLGNPRLSRVFYSDNGSTGCEVAIKMALRASRVRFGWEGSTGGDVGVIGLRGSYHGDTIGAMDCAEPGEFNKEVDWYRGKGYWFEFPRVLGKGGKWIVETPGEGRTEEFETLGEVFELEKREGGEETVKMYEEYINSTLERLIKKEGRRFGAVIIEPVVLGAGGMQLVDPLFQKALISAVRSSPHFPTPTPASQSPLCWTGLPIIFDEVFTGLYRLGRLTSSSLIDTHADISVHAKLLTGGLVPLCVTLASEDVFAAFLGGGEKREALLHGHSYTAHAVGCNVALDSVRRLMKMDKEGAWSGPKADWSVASEELAATVGEEGVWSVFSKEFVRKLSFSEHVEGVWALGSVLAIHLKSSHTGYTSPASQTLLQSLSEIENGWNIHARALGNVIYFMASQAQQTQGSSVRGVEERVGRLLGVV